MPPDRHHNALEKGYPLHWYRIESVLGQGGFGITYLAADTNLGQPVAIKEFLPSELAVRTRDSNVHPVSDSRSDTFGWGLSRFLSEARTLAQFRHPNIVRVYSVFEANGTAYMVMEYEQGTSLEDALKFRRVEGERALLAIVHALMDGLDLVHAAGFIHRDIKPDNVYLRAADGVPVLLDFGSARQAVGAQTRTLTSLVTPGYAPFEQYNATREQDRQGPWTDIYSLAATLYRGATGRGPIDAVARADALLSGEVDPLLPMASLELAGFSPQFAAAVDAGLAFQPGERPQSLAQWRTLLPPRPTHPDFATVVGGPRAPQAAGPDEETVIGGAREAVTVPRDTGGAVTDAAAPPPAKTAPSRPLRAPAMAIAALGALAVAGAVAWWLVPRPPDAASPAPGASPPPPAERASARPETSAPPAAPAQGAAEAEAARAGAGEPPAGGAASLADERALLQAERRALEGERARLALEGERRAAEQARRTAEREGTRLAAERQRLEEERRLLAARREEAATPPAGNAPAGIAPAELASDTASPAPAAQASGATAAQADPRREAPDAARERVRTLLAQADEHFDALRLTSPEGRNAVASYREVLALAPHDPRALAGLERVVTRYLELAGQAAADGDPARARVMLSRARRVDPDSAAVARAVAELDARDRAAGDARDRAAEEEARARARAQDERRARESARLAQERERLDAERRRLEEERARREADARAAEAASARAKAERAAAEARARAQAEARRQVRLAVFPNEFSVTCFHPVGPRIEEAARRAVRQRERMEFVYSYYRAATDTSMFGDGSAMWQGSVARKSPRVDAVRSTARTLGADAVVMGFYTCTGNQYVDEDRYDVQVFLIDVPSGEVRSAGRALLDTGKAVDEVLRALDALRGG